ncbi:MAG: tetratricopeptide repeat protein [Spirulinaceae cyanobacterium]
MSQLLGERYQAVKILKTYGFGKTYLAADTQLPDRPKCIIKQLQYPDTSPKSYKLLQILLEKKAEALTSIAPHPQIPELLDYFQGRQHFYLVEEFIPGTSLEKEIGGDRPFSQSNLIQLLQESLTALSVIHDAGLIHLNLKPSNLIRHATTGKLMLIGLGIFHDICDRAWRSHTQTTPGDLNGSALYLAPEQQEDQPQFNSDLYTLGIVAIQAATGYSRAELSTYALAAEPSSPQEAWHYGISLDPRLIQLLNRLIHPASQQRYQLTKDALADLQSLQHNTVVNSGLNLTPKPQNPPTNPPLEPEPSLLPPTAPTPRNKRGWRWGIGAVVLGSAIAVLMGIQMPQRLTSRYFSHRGQTAAESDRPQIALNAYNRALQLHPNNTTALYQRGLTHDRLGNTTAALEDFTQAIQQGSTSIEAYYQRGNLRLQLGDYQGAIADYTQALELNPNYTQAYVNRGNAQASLGNERQATQDYTKAIEQDGNFAAAYLNRCLSRSNLGDHFGAVEDCTKAINLRPTHPYAYQNRGLARRRVGDFQGAIMDYNTAIELNPEDAADPYYNRGLARYDLGDTQGAINDFSIAIELNEDHVLAYYDRARLWLEQGDRARAISDFQIAATRCLELSRIGCYEDAQYQLNELGVTLSEVNESNSGNANGD